MTLSEFRTKLNRIPSAIADRENDILLAGFTASQSLMLSRIFQFGRAADESLIGIYSEAYLKFRASKGLETRYKDLTVTTSLRNSIRIVIDNNVYVLAIVDERNEDIAVYQESLYQNGTVTSPDDFKIFRLSKKELEVNHLAVDELIREIIQETLAYI